MSTNVAEEKPKRARAQINYADLHSGSGKREKVIASVEEEASEPINGAENGNYTAQNNKNNEKRGSDEQGGSAKETIEAEIVLNSDPAGSKPTERLEIVESGEEDKQIEPPESSEEDSSSEEEEEKEADHADAPKTKPNAFAILMRQQKHSGSNSSSGAQNDTAKAGKEDAKVRSEKPPKKLQAARGRYEELWREHYELNPKFKSDGSGDSTSHICKSCQKAIIVLGIVDPVTKKVSKRNQYQLMDQHFESAHKKLHTAKWAEVERRKAEEEAKNKSAAEKDADETAQAATIAITPINANALMVQVMKEIPPLYTLNIGRSEEKQILGLFAVAIAEDGLPQTAGEKRGMRQFLRAIGVDIGFDHKTIGKYQAVLAADYLDRAKKEIQIQNDFTPNRFSLSLDVWSRDGGQLVGGIITFVRIGNNEPTEFVLGLEEMNEGASADDIAAAGKRLLDRVGLEMHDLYSCTNDNANVARAASRKLASHYQNCYSHLSKLVLDDQLTTPDTKDDVQNILEIEELADEPHVIRSKSKKVPRFPEIDRMVKAAAALASHMNRSPLGQRLMTEFQLKKGVEKEEHCVVYARTRWTGLFECIRQHAFLITNCYLCEFLSSYQASKISANVLRMMMPKMADARQYEILASILFPLFVFTKRTEETTISLAEAYLAALELYREYQSDCLKLVDRQGYIVEKTVEIAGKKRDQFKNVQISSLDEEFRSFRSGLATSIGTRLIEGEREDELLISIFLDPKARRLLDAKKADPKLREHVSQILDNVERIESVIHNRMEYFTKLRSPTTMDIVDEPDVEPIEVPPHLDPSILESLSEEDRAEILLEFAHRLKEETKVENASTTTGVTDELRRLKEAMQVSQLDEASFWKLNRSLYPNAYCVYLQVRCIRPSTARLESVFSLASCQVPDERSSTKNETLNTKLILKTAKMSRPQIIAAVEKIADPGRPKGQKEQTH